VLAHAGTIGPSDALLRPAALFASQRAAVVAPQDNGSVRQPLDFTALFEHGSDGRE